jgi:hypothetical protein
MIALLSLLIVYALVTRLTWREWRRQRSMIA